MSAQVQEIELERRAGFFKALGHPVRLLILSLVQRQPRHGEELAAILGLNPATVSHHLALLAEAGLVTAHKDQYYQTYSLAAEALQPRLADLISVPQFNLDASVTEDAFQERVLRIFFKQGRLVKLPVQKKKQRIVLEKIVQAFEPGRDYTEREVNLELLEFNDDVASLRRALIEHHLMQRQQGIYRRM
jgi:biotin operon repressor